MLPCNKYGALWILLCCDMMSVMGQHYCQSAHVKTTNLTAALDSDILLPCDFEPSLLQVAKSGNVAVVWTYGDISNLVEISLSGQPSYWDHRRGRLRTFRNMPGNFSLLIGQVQASDLGRYRCELFDGLNCSIAYVVVEISLQELLSENTLAHQLVDNWYWFVAAGGFLIISLLITCLCCVWHRCFKTPQSSLGNTASDAWADDSCYANISHHRDQLGRETEHSQHWSMSVNCKEQEKGQAFSVQRPVSIYGNDYENICSLYANHVVHQL